LILAFFGGVYNNAIALAAAISDARRRGASRLFCLGDMGAFGPHPDRVFPLLRNANVECIQGNYDHSVGNGLNDCQCGYTDPQDNFYAKISYDYTFENTSRENRRWMRDLPTELRFETDGIRFLLCHGSPRRTNEFLWESTTSTHFLERTATDCDADILLGTHTGIHWQRCLSGDQDGGGGRRFVNVGVLGRPENDGRTNVWYAIVRTGRDAVRAKPQAADQERESDSDRIDVEFVPLEYDHGLLADEMRAERLPQPFIETVLSGWWTTCLEVLPAKERRRGRF